jgi:hypothetical protein
MNLVPYMQYSACRQEGVNRAARCDAPAQVGMRLQYPSNHIYFHIYSASLEARRRGFWPTTQGSSCTMLQGTLDQAAARAVKNAQVRQSRFTGPLPFCGPFFRGSVDQVVLRAA